MSQYHSARIGLLFENTLLAESLAAELKGLVNYIPVVNVTSDEAGEAAVPQAQTFLISDWELDRLKGYCSPERFAAVLLVKSPSYIEQRLPIESALDDNLIYIAADEEAGKEMVKEIMSRIFPMSEERQLEMAIQNKQHLRLLDHIGKELSVFYHNISNPLTVLSGNIQLLQLLADTISISDDLMKPITDIAIVSTRFEEDLKAITDLREKIRAGNLHNEDV